MIEAQQSFTLIWCSFSSWGRVRFTFCFSYKGTQYFVYDCLQPVAPQITQDTRPTIVDALLTLILMMGQGGNRYLCCKFKVANSSLMTVYNQSPPRLPKLHNKQSLMLCCRSVDTPLTLISKMGQGGYCNVFYLSKCLIIPLWLYATYRQTDYPGCMTKNCWHCVDAHFQDEVGSVLLWFLSIKAANTLIMYNHGQIDHKLPDLDDLKLLTLHWRSFCHGCIPNMKSLDLV